MLLIEFLLCTCQTGRLTYFFALNGLYQVLQTLYNAYYALGFFAYVFALISYLPFTHSFLRMVWRDSETRRLIFYRNCIRMWMFTVAIDVWVFFNLVPDVANMCASNEVDVEQTKIARYFKLDYVPNELILTMCIYRFQFTRLNMYMLNHF